MSPAEEEAWQEYWRERTDAARNQVAGFYLHLISHAARRIRPPTWSLLEIEDLKQAGMLGLFEAIASFDPEKNIRFTTFAQLRVRGSMIDHLRKFDWVPRDLRARERRGEITTRKMVALSVLMPPGKQQEEDIPLLNLADQKAPPPDYRIQKQAFWESMCKQFSARDRQIFLLVYRDGKTMKQAGQQFGLSESRVSQVLTKLLKQLKQRSDLCK